MKSFSPRLPQSRGLETLATSNHKTRARQGQPRRRTISLESLERRALLAGNVTVSSVVAGVLTITGDTHNDTFTITEDGGNEVTVTGGTTTTVNNAFLPVNSYGVSNINVALPSGAVVNTDNVTLTQTASTFSGIANVSFTVAPSSTVAAELILAVTGVTNTGTFTLTDGSSTVAGGTLNTATDDSAFAAISIQQSGCCPASISLEGDTVAGAVSVTEGWEIDDTMYLLGDKFGSTTLTQGFGPGEGTPGNVGAEQDVDVSDSDLSNLAIAQNGSGGTDEIEVIDVEVQLTSFGIVATQLYSGGADDIDIISISTLGTPTNQPFSILDSIFTRQGDGNGEFTGIENATVYGNMTSIQGSGTGDSVEYLGDEAGFSLTSGPVITEIEGRVTISQGSGPSDTVDLDCGGVENPSAMDTFNDVILLQGGVPGTRGCAPEPGDLATVNCTTITSDLEIEQGASGNSIGNNVLEIAATSAVVVGDATLIDEVGGNNGNDSIYLGGFNPPDNAFTTGVPDFETAYLDVYTGAQGGAFVQVYNTLVDVGAQGLFGAYEIEGGGTGNIAVIDLYSYIDGGVYADPAVFNILLV